MSWLFSRALVEEFSGGTSLGGAPPAPLSVMPTPHKFSRNDKTMEPSQLSRFGLMCEVLTGDRGEALLMSYRAAFPVKTSALPAGGPESTEPEADSGARWSESWARWDQSGSTWRTAQFSLLGGLEQFWGTWPRSGLMRHGECYPLPSAELRTSESASGSWPTPAANEYEAAPEVTIARRERIKAQGINGNGFGLTVGQAAQMWATPCTPNGGRIRQDTDHIRPDGSKRQVSLETQARAWGTPTTRDQKDTGDCSNVPDNGLRGRMAKSWSGMTDRPGSLSPEFHLWLMGWPTGWTALEPLEMGKYQLWLQRHLPPSPQSLSEAA
jgi:hypothetical protein